MGKIWQCQFCDHTTEPSEYGYRRMQAHMNFSHKKDERACQLIDQDTGEVLADTMEEARNKNLLLPNSKAIKPPGRHPQKARIATPTAAAATPTTTPRTQAVAGQEATVEETPATPGNEEPEDQQGHTIINPEVKDGVFRYLMILPADAWYMLNVAKAIGAEPPEKLLDEWTYECMQKRLELDYQIQIIVAPIAPSEEE